jgi:hypothetical protein
MILKLKKKFYNVSPRNTTLIVCMVIGVNNNDCPSVLALIDMGLILDANHKYDYKLFTKNTG